MVHIRLSAQLDSGSGVSLEQVEGKCSRLAAGAGPTGLVFIHQVLDGWLVFGAEPAWSGGPLPHLQRLDWMLIVLSVALAAARASAPSHHLHTVHNCISTMGLNVGLNSAPITPLAHASTVVQAFHRWSPAVRGAFAGHLFQSVQTDSSRDDYELLALKAFRSLQ